MSHGTGMESKHILAYSQYLSTLNHKLHKMCDVQTSVPCPQLSSYRLLA